MIISLLLKFKLISLNSLIEQIPPELLLFKTIGTVLVRGRLDCLACLFLLLLQLVHPHSLVNETITASRQTNLSPKNIRRYEEVLLKPQLQPFFKNILHLVL